MNCDYVKQNAVLLVYDELSDDAKFEMERHLELCPACSAEVESTRNFRVAMAAAPLLEPSPNLLAASRMRFQEALETAEQRGWHRFTFDFAGWMRALRFSPALATLIFIFGFGGGAIATWQIAQNAIRNGNVPRVAPNTEAAISGIRSIDAQPGSDKVEIKYDRVIHEQAQGSMNDPSIQQLLLYAAHSNLNSGMRMESIDLLTQRPEDERVREALIYALRYETNPGARLKSVQALAPYVKQDARVRDAMLEAITNDESPGVRIEALHGLDAVKTDSSVRRVLSDLAKSDPNQYIRRKAQEVLNTTTVD